jgi:hypothetical protein
VLRPSANRGELSPVNHPLPLYQVTARTVAWADEPDQLHIELPEVAGPLPGWDRIGNLPTTANIGPASFRRPEFVAAGRWHRYHGFGSGVTR